MNSDLKTDESESAGDSNCVKSLLTSTLLLLVISATIGLTINTLRPGNKIDLSRDYFPSRASSVVPGQRAQQENETSKPEEGDLSSQGNEVSSGNGTSDESIETVPDDGMQRLSFEDVRDHFETGEAEFESSGESIVVFVDARVKDQYEDGHIPGSVWLYHYESESLIDDLKPQLEMAFFVIVYCNGGDCEDSLHLASDLGSLYGLPPENIYVYEGGFNEWKEMQMPITVGTEVR
ncbi:MAG: hypothetical protein GWP41_10970 [Planctomycetia bacterium]|jgi:rhodanese-related sulfurtransferase|nr:hypothetical protein [Planctomycetia bacterium]